jgi:hypothetical protein
MMERWRIVTCGISGGGGRSRGRFATPADFPRHDCSDESEREGDEPTRRGCGRGVGGCVTCTTSYIDSMDGCFFLSTKYDLPRTLNVCAGMPPLHELPTAPSTPPES